MSHPDHAELLQHARDGAGVTMAATAGHLARCPSCADQVLQLRTMQALLAIDWSPNDSGPGCMGDDLVAALVDGTMDASARSQAIGHLAACANCRMVVAAVQRALADPAVATAAITIDRPRRVARLAIPAAAAAALLLAILARGVDDRTSAGHRAPAITGVDQPTAIAPLGAVVRPESLRWARVPGADRYRATLFQADGRVLYELEVRDTVVELPDSVTLVPGVPYRWMVEARSGWRRWSTSRLFQFSIDGDQVP